MEPQIQEIKERVHIADIVGEYVKLERAGISLRAKCPFHKEKTPSFFVSVERNTYICFGCGEKGDIFSFIQKMEGIGFNDALRQLAKRAGVQLENRNKIEDKSDDQFESLYAICEEATKYFESVLSIRDDVRKYIHDRGVTDTTIGFWRLGYAPSSWEELSTHLLTKEFSKDDIVRAGLAASSEKNKGDIYDRFRGRIIFPIFDIHGRVVGFSGRFFEQISGSRSENDPAKYVNSPETPLFRKSKILYGLDRAKQAIRKTNCILLVEGQFDLVLAHQAGLPFTVALSGTALTFDHLSLLGRLSKRLVLALDADEAGLRSGLKSTHMALIQDFDVKIPFFPENKDPADIAKESPLLLKKAVRDSKTCVEFFLDALETAAHDSRSYKKTVETQILPLVAAITSKIDQAHFVSIIAHRLGVPEAAVRSELMKVSTKQYAVQYAVKDISTDTGVLDTHEKPVPEIDASSTERAAAMLLLRYGTASQEATRVYQLIDKTRIDILLQRLRDDSELLRFSFDALGNNADEITEALFQTLERGIIDEELKSLQSQLRRQSSEDNHAELLKKFSALKQRQEELRK